MIYISIILSAYNHEKTIGRCLESVMAQDNIDLQMECIVVDDSSTDQTLAVIRRMVGAYKGSVRFRIYRHQTHHGLSRTRNTGLVRAEGQYVLFLNAADQLRPGCIDSYMVNLMRHWDTDVVAGNVFHTALSRNLFTQLSSAMVLRGRGDVMFNEVLRSHLFLYANNKLVRRELLVNNQVMFDEKMAYADIHWVFTLFGCVSSVMLIPEITYEYGKGEAGSIGQTQRWVNSLLDSYAATCDVLLAKAPRPESSDNGYYQTHQLFLYGLLTHGDRLMEEFSVNSQVRRELGNMRSRLLVQTKNDGQKMLYLFFKQEGSLLSGLFKNPLFKKYREAVDHVVELLDMLTVRNNSSVF